MSGPSLTSYAIGAILSVLPVSLAAENVISAGITWADSEGCRVLGGGFRGQAFTILTREEIRFWEMTCFINSTRYADGQSLMVDATCEDIEHTTQEVFQMGSRIGGPVRLHHEGWNWEAFLNEC